MACHSRYPLANWEYWPYGWQTDPEQSSEQILEAEPAQNGAREQARGLPETIQAGRGVAAQYD